MDIISTEDPKISVAAKIPTSWGEEIDSHCELSGITKSQWVSNLIGERLNKFNDDFISLLIETLKHGSIEMKRQALKKLLIFVAHSI